MKSKELLFELIQSLTKSEKRYFTVFTSIHKESNNYVKLFNAIQIQEEYDEKEIMALFEGEDFIRQFSVAKNYLMNLIIKCLRNYHQNAKKSIELNNYLTEIEILYWKGLYKLAHKKINQAQKIAAKYDLLPYLLQLKYWNSRVEDYVSNQFMNESAIYETKALLSSYNKQMQLNFLTKKMGKITKQSIKSTEQSIRPIKEILKHELLKINEEDLDNFYSKSDYLFLKGVGNSLLGNEKEEIHYLKKMLTFLEKNPHQIEENPLSYASSLNNILLHYYSKGYTKDFPIYLDKLEDIDLKFNHAKAAFYEYKYNLKIGYYLHLRDVNQVENALKEMETWYSSKESKKSIQIKMICEYNIALVNFFLNNTKLCLKWCNSCFSLFDMKAKKFRHDLAISTLVLQTIVYYELSYFDLGLKMMKMIFSIAKSNHYSKVEMDIFNELKSLLVNQNEEEVLVHLKKVIENQKYKLINIDRDIIEFWLEKKGC